MDWWISGMCKWNIINLYFLLFILLFLRYIEINSVKRSNNIVNVPSTFLSVVHLFSVRCFFNVKSSFINNRNYLRDWIFSVHIDIKRRVWLMHGSIIPQWIKLFLGRGWGVDFNAKLTRKGSVACLVLNVENANLNLNISFISPFYFILRIYLKQKYKMICPRVSFNPKKSQKKHNSMKSNR